jgi:hypothetical protein
MNINIVSNAARVGEIVVFNKKTSSQRHVLYEYPLKLIWDDTFPREMKKQHVSLVYIFAVNDIIYKIGQSSTKSGISGCMQFYLNAGLDDPGINRFAINYFIREELKKNNKVEVYMIYAEPITYDIKGLFSSRMGKVPISAKGMEQYCLEDYFNITGEYPKWNYQENSVALPSYIHEAFGQYKLDRKRK